MSMQRMASRERRASDHESAYPSGGLVSLNQQGSHEAAYPIWLNWQMQAHPVLHEWLEMMWWTLVITR